MFGKSDLTPEEIEVRTWAFVVRSITVMVLIIAIGVMYAVAFEQQDSVLAPIDAVFLEILKAIAFMGVGTLGGIAGRRVVSSAAQIVGTKPEEE
mgnify:CR=1 FL=1|tara:strand:+ start:843 stop:1124 length:282 start_codon:yes stop_codon:yes gene_type:complete